MTFFDDGEAERMQIAAELAEAIQDLDALLERTRISERLRISHWLSLKSQTVPFEQRLLYRLIADDIRKGAHSQ